MSLYASDVAGIRSETPRRDLRAGVLALPAERLAQAMEDPEIEDLFIAAMKHGLRNGERTCIRTYAEARKLVGTHDDLMAKIAALIGAAVPVARNAVDTVRNASELAGNRDAMIAKMCRFLSAEAAKDGCSVADYFARQSGAEVEG